MKMRSCVVNVVLKWESLFAIWFWWPLHIWINHNNHSIYWSNLWNNAKYNQQRYCVCDIRSLNHTFFVWHFGFLSAHTNTLFWHRFCIDKILIEFSDFAFYAARYCLSRAAIVLILFEQPLARLFVIMFCNFQWNYSKYRSHFFERKKKKKTQSCHMSFEYWYYDVKQRE